MNVENIVEIKQGKGFALLRFTGFIDASSVTQLRPALQTHVPATCPNFVVDLSQVDFLDSHGVGLFVSLLKRAHLNHGRLLIAGAEGQPAAVLEMVGLNDSYVTYCKDVGEAEKALGVAGSKAETG